MAGPPNQWASRRLEYFAALKPWLTGDPEPPSQGAVTVAIHWLRRRFHEALKGEIARMLTLPTWKMSWRARSRPKGR